MPSTKSKSPSRTSKDTKRPKSASGSSSKRDIARRRNERSPQSSPDRTTKRAEQIPRRTPDKKGKRAETPNEENSDKNAKPPEQKLPRIPEKLIRNAEITLNRKNKQQQPIINDSDKKNTNNDKITNKLIKPVINKTKNHNPTNPISTTVQPIEEKKDKRILSLPQKILRRRQNSDNNEVNTPKTKSQRAICVNTVKHWYSVLDSDIIEDPAGSSGRSGKGVDRKKNASRTTIKRLMRRQFWNVSKSIIKGNEKWTKLMKENKIDIDKINIDAVDLSLIDVDALGIENKLLKSTVTWLLK